MKHWSKLNEKLSSNQIIWFNGLIKSLNLIWANVSLKNREMEHLLSLFTLFEYLKLDPKETCPISNPNQIE